MEGFEITNARVACIKLNLCDIFLQKNFVFSISFLNSFNVRHPKPFSNGFLLTKIKWQVTCRFENVVSDINSQKYAQLWRSYGGRAGCKHGFCSERMGKEFLSEESCQFSGRFGNRCVVYSKAAAFVILSLTPLVRVLFSSSE